MWVKIFTSKDDFLNKVKERSVNKLIINDKHFCITRLDNKIYIHSNECSHEKANMSNGKLKNNSLECPWHHYQFDLETGNPIDYNNKCNPLKR